MNKLLVFALSLIFGSHALFAQKVTLIEYFFDEDKGFGKNPLLTVNPSDSAISRDLNIQVPANMPLGFHKLYLRAKDSNGKWGHTVLKNIEVVRKPDPLRIVEVEYFTKTDAGIGECISENLKPSADSTWTIKIPEGSFNLGRDTVFVRVKDNQGKWSHTDTLTVRPRVVTGLHDQEKNALFSLAPNPTTDRIEITLHDGSAPTQFTLINTLGEVIQQQTLTDNNTVINTDHPAGTYFLTLSNGLQAVTKKLILQAR